MGFPEAGSSDLLRAAQKDEYILQTLHLRLLEAISPVLGSRVVARFQKEIQTLAEMMYYVPNTAFGRQTPGEEYSDVLQVTHLDGRQRLPTAAQRLKLIFWQVVFPYVSAVSFTRLDVATRPPMFNLAVNRRPAAQFFHDRVNPTVQLVLPHLQRLFSLIDRGHLAAFYLTGRFFHISKRVAGFHMILRRKPTGNNRYGILGVLLGVQVALEACFFANELRQKARKRQAGTVDDDYSDSDDGGRTSIDDDARRKCALCLSRRHRTTVTECGHLYCWKCIVEWCVEKPECPLCRQRVVPQSLVLVQDY